MTIQSNDPLPPAPRPRTSLRNAMRQQGIDEHKIAFLFNEQVDRLRNAAAGEDSKKPAPEEKLILDVLKECVKIIDPEARASTADGPSIIQLNHQVPRPDRQQSGANGHAGEVPFNGEQ